MLIYLLLVKEKKEVLLQQAFVHVSGTSRVCVCHAKCTGKVSEYKVTVAPQ